MLLIKTIVEISRYLRNFTVSQIFFCEISQISQIFCEISQFSQKFVKFHKISQKFVKFHNFTIQFFFPIQIILFVIKVL